MAKRASIAVERDNSYSVQMAHLREFTAKYGVLHDAQTLQLKVWPRIAFDYAEASECKADLRGRIVHVYLSQSKKTPKNFKARANGFCESVQWMLGNEWQVKIYENKKLIFTSNRKVSIPQEKYTGTDFEAGRIVPEKPWQFPKTPKSSKPT